MSSLYIHIPFCAKRCHYCDFHSGTDVSLRDSYIMALALELKSRISEIDLSRVRTIYIGGGTPSQLTPSQLTQLFDILGKNINLSQCEEITIEVNPDDITPEYAAHIAQLPINRVSMGVQSFNDRLLSLIGRRHDAERAILSYNILQEAGIKNISIDLMFSLPTQTIVEWESSIDMALSLAPQHISAYDLSYEEGSVLTRKMRKGEITPCDEESSAKMYNLLVDKLSDAGYEHYEISNFALPNYRSKHNSGYWKGTPYLGLGASAHSFDGSVRRANVADTKLYIKKVIAGESAYEVEELSDIQKYNETIFTRLRTSEGINKQYIKETFGDNTLQHLIKESASYIADGSLKEVEDNIVLTRKGILISDAICCDLFL
ncbi:MAG: radical SAM family heme chaperone HemW [Bacteroidales bacterium]|nr:radical SAM family heme chaperone HemW [Bacteroidales bacterium]